MKNLYLLLLLVIALVLVTCKKEEKEMLPLTTVIEGRIINHNTQLPIKDIKLFFSEEVDPNPGDAWGWDSYTKVTDSEGEFSFTHTSNNSYDVIVIGPYFDFDPISLYSPWNDYQKDSVFINGQLNPTFFYNGHGGKFFYLGLGVKEGENYSFDIELVSK